ncbi:MAG: UbiX family flavin prenyltransferase [Planctomycetes bacterium]|nr:UbiX family flavin prenyltransferase [Planctomycetota bacterium]
MNQPIVVGITGASGAVYAVRLIELLLEAGCEVHLAISPSGKTVIAHELNLNVDLNHFLPDALLRCSVSTSSLHYHHFTDFMAPIASGSFVTGGMVICPCSGTTLSSVARAAGTNLIQRAAEVHLKERRKLILVPRETPLSLPQINNMKLATEAGAIILPAMPGWYHGVNSLSDLVDFVVCRILDQLGIKTDLMQRWGDMRSRD